MAIKPYFLAKKERSKRHISTSGDAIHIPKKWTIVDGEHVWIDDKPINLDERIQAHKDAVDLQSILQRYQSGDKTALDRVNTMYIDAIDMPKSYAQMFERVDDMKKIFASMPLEIKNKFNNNPATFWKKSGSPEFNQILNEWRSDYLSKSAIADTQPVDVKPLVSEVIKNESE